MVRETYLPAVVVYSGRQDLPSSVSFLSSPPPPHSFTCAIFATQANHPKIATGLHAFIFAGG